MLLKTWTPSAETFNPPQTPTQTQTPTPDTIKRTWRNLVYYTKDFEDTFSNIDKAIIFSDMSNQIIHIQNEVKLFTKYHFFNKAI